MNSSNGPGGGVKWGPKGLILNTMFEGGVKLSPMYDHEAMQTKLDEEKKVEKEKSDGSEEEA